MALHPKHPLQVSAWGTHTHAVCTARRWGHDLGGTPASLLADAVAILGNLDVWLDTAHVAHERANQGRLEMWPTQTDWPVCLRTGQVQDVVYASDLYRACTLHTGWERKDRKHESGGHGAHCPIAKPPTFPTYSC